jgi:hypothetical protein
VASRNRKSGFSRGWSAFFAAVIILGGATVSLGFGVRLRSALERNADSRMTVSSEALQSTVEEQLARYVDTVRLTAAALGSLDTPNRDAFEQLSKAVASQQLTAVRAIRFVAPSTPEAVDEVQPYWRARGADGLRIKPLKGANQHLFTIFSRGLSGGKAPPIGVDQVAAVAEVEVARVARTSNGVAVSDAYVLLSDAALPEAERQLSFDVVAPVAGDDDKVAGYVMLSVGGTDFVTTLLTRVAGDLLDVQLMTRSGSGELAQVATVVHEGRNADVRRAQDFESGQRQWVMQVSADRRQLLPTAGRTDMVVVIAGTTLSVMFGMLLYLQFSANQRIEREIEAEVAERLAAQPDQPLKEDPEPEPDSQSSEEVQQGQHVPS